jgi:hypothetical protein
MIISISPEQTTIPQNEVSSPSIVVPGDFSRITSTAGDMVNSMSRASQIERGNTSAVLEIDTDKLFADLRIPPDQYGDASNHLKEIQSNIAALLELPPDQSKDAIKRMDAIGKSLQEMLDQLRSQQETTTIYRYYDAFLKHSRTWYGQAAVGVAIAGLKNIFPSILNRGWLWSSFASGWVGATVGNHFVRKYQFPVDVTYQALVQESVKTGAYELEKFIRSKT